MALKKMQEQQRETENAQFEETAKKIWQAIEQTSDLKGLEKNLLIDHARRAAHSGNRPRRKADVPVGQRDYAAPYQEAGSPNCRCHKITSQ